MSQALAELTTIHVGGVPKRIQVANSRDELVAIAKEVWARTENWLVLGGGSNLVAADDISDLEVIQVRNLGLEYKGQGRLRVQAGENWNDFVIHAAKEGLAGVESLAGIPGTVGAAPIQNIGAYGQELSLTFHSLEFLDYETNEIQIMTKADCQFGYRDSIFKRGKRGIVTWVEFQFFTDLPAAHSELLEARVEEVIGQRASKGMVLDDKDHDTWSCGSFFTNPIVSESFAKTLPLDSPQWPTEADDGLTVKLSAAWLIEQSGIQKGFSLPGSKAAISSKHALAITNRGDATAEEVVELARYIQTQVSNKFGINLEPEPYLIGF
jgi:UDP-N-acetylmuramate dehydrogenase